MSKSKKKWTREKLYLHCAKQSRQHGFDIIEVKGVINDKRWNPIERLDEFDLVKGSDNPMYPCVRFSYDKVVGINGNRRFYDNLKKSDMLTFKKRVWFIGILLGWVFYYKWVSKTKKK